MSFAASVKRSVLPGRSPPILPLEQGDHLNRFEFERRYNAMPWLKKAELIDGVVYVTSSVSYDHSSPHFKLIGWLGKYEDATPGVEGGDNASLRFDDENEPQPDALLRLLPECGGQSRIDEEGYLVGTPELVAEVALSSASYDLHGKLHVYERRGVRETWSGACGTARSIGSGFMAANLCVCRNLATAFIKVGSFQGFGLTRRPCFEGTSGRCERSPTAVWLASRIRSLRLGWKAA